MLRYVAALLLVVLAMLAIRRLLRGRGAGGTRTAGGHASRRPAATWPWLLVPVVIVLLLWFGFAYRNWALAP